MGALCSKGERVHDEESTAGAGDELLLAQKEREQQLKGQEEAKQGRGRDKGRGRGKAKQGRGGEDELRKVHELRKVIDELQADKLALQASASKSEAARAELRLEKDSDARDAARMQRSMTADLRKAETGIKLLKWSSQRCKVGEYVKVRQLLEACRDKLGMRSLSWKNWVSEMNKDKSVALANVTGAGLSKDAAMIMGDVGDFASEWIHGEQGDTELEGYAAAVVDLYKGGDIKVYMALKEIYEFVHGPGKRIGEKIVEKTEKAGKWRDAPD